MSSISEVIAKALDTPEGRKRIADAMVQPFRCGGKDYELERRKKGTVEIADEQEASQ